MLSQISMQEYNTNLKLFKCQDFLKLNIKNWKYNRPVDETRIPSISDYIRKNKRIEGIIYLAYQKDTNIYHCYDGIHRYYAIQNMIGEQIDFTDILGLSDIDYTVIVDIMEYDYELIRERFVNINSSLPVPTIYTEHEQKLDKIHIIENMFSYIYDIYPCFVKPNKKTNIPNINNFVFNEKFSCIIEQHGLYNFDYWKKQFMKFNVFMSSLPSRTTHTRGVYYNQLKLTEKQKQKCQKYKFYCFATKQWDLYFLNFLNKC